MASFLYTDVEEWAEAYIRVHEAEASLDESHPDYLAAYEFIQDLKGPLAEVCWQGILAVVARKPSERVLGMVAAGLMEDLLEDAGEAFIERIEQQAAVNPVFKAMLSGCWQSGSAAVWARFEAACKQ
jgi:hypothetical protein